MSKMKIFSLLTLAVFLLTPPALQAQGQPHKGISFQGVIKLPNGEYPTITAPGLTVNAMILSNNNCILREEQFSGVIISNGYINVPIGTGTVAGDDPGLSMKQVMDNTSHVAGLKCLDSNSNRNPGSFDPTTGDGRRKFRLSVTIEGVPIVADFNMRSMAYAISAESADDAKKLNGKSDASFIQTSLSTTQDAVDRWFSSQIFLDLVNNIAGLADVATSGSYNDLLNKPAIPAAQVSADWNATSGVAQILNKPTLGPLASKSSVDLSSSEATGLLASGRFPALSGDVTNTAGSLATTIANNAVTTGKINDLAVTDVKINDVSATKITGTLPVGKGGTGLTATPANGQIPIGNGTGFALKTLTAGSNITITDSAGSITIASADYWWTACPAGYVEVPPLAPYTQKSFCVMKYEAKTGSASVAATTAAAGTPVVSINRDNARASCKLNGAGYDLISNAQWQTIARNIADTPSNWGTEGQPNATAAYGAAALSHGHSDGIPNNALAANADDTVACDGTEQTCSNTDWSSQRRTFYLSNGSVLWDFAGNVWEWVRDNNTTTQGAEGFLSTMNANDSRQNNFGNDQFCNAPGGSPYCGMGYGYTNSSAGAVFRGSNWSNGMRTGVFTSNLTGGPTVTITSLGFRCVYQP